MHKLFSKNMSCVDNHLLDGLQIYSDLTPMSSMWITFFYHGFITTECTEHTEGVGVGNGLEIRTSLVDIAPHHTRLLLFQKNPFRVFRVFRGLTPSV